MKKKNLIIAILTGIIVAAAAFIDLKLFRGAYSVHITMMSAVLGIALICVLCWMFYCAAKRSTDREATISELSSIFTVKFLLSFIPFFVIEAIILFVISRTDIPEEDINIYYAHIVAVLSVIISLAAIFIRQKRYISVIFALLAPTAVFFIEENILQNPFVNMDILPILFGLILFYLLTILLCTVFSRTDIPILIVTFISSLAGLINYYCLQFRSVPFFPADILSARAALSVVGGYSINIIPSIGLSICSAILVIQIAFLFNTKIFTGDHALLFRTVSSVLSCIVFCGFTFFSQTDTAHSLFKLMHDPFIVYSSVCHDGYAASFVLNLPPSIKRPSDYSVSKVKNVSSHYLSDNITDAPDDLPNVIVLMNESWSDLSVIADYETNHDCFEFINSLGTDIIRGNAHVSVVAGNTPNSEYEFLTSQTLAFYPAGTIPYSSVVNGPMQNLASQFNALGYSTIAYHPYMPELWNRPSVYKNFGFESFFSASSFDNLEDYGNFTSDRSMYKNIETILESSTSPLFLFGVTLQNHGGYTDNGNAQFDTSAKNIDNEAVRVYLSLVRESDQAFKDLIAYLSKQDKKTIVLMFGDHQPNDSVVVPLMQNSEPRDFYNFEDTTAMYERYITPYVIWSNYDIDYDAPKDISLNYLSSILMDVCGLPKTASQKYLLDLSKEYPVISSKFFSDAEGNVYTSDNYSAHPLLRDYSCLQYNYIADRKHLISEFWELK